MKILLAYDGSPCSELALKELVRFPVPADSTVKIIMVEAPLEPSLLMGAPTALDELVRQRMAEAVRRLQGAVETLTPLVPQVRVTSKLVEGSPKDAIIAEAETWGADLIVIGSHGYGPIRRFFLGSVSHYVASQAPCSVLIVRCSSDTIST